MPSAKMFFALCVALLQLHHDCCASSLDDDGTFSYADIVQSHVSVDTTFYYRLQNRKSKSQLALDVKNDGKFYELKMNPVSTNSGQYWRFVHLGGNIYKLQTRFLGNKYSLDIDPTSVNRNIPHMAKTAHVTGQRWWVSRLSDKRYALSNEYNGRNSTLGIARGMNLAYMVDNVIMFPEQHWTLSRIEKIGF